MSGISSATRLSLGTVVVMSNPSEVQALRRKAHHARLMDSGWVKPEDLRTPSGRFRSGKPRVFDSVMGLSGSASEGFVFSVSTDWGVVVPAFQLTMDGQPRPELTGVLGILASSGVCGWELWTWLTTPTSWLSGEVPEIAASFNPSRVEQAARNFISN